MGGLFGGGGAVGNFVSNTVSRPMSAIGAGAGAGGGPLGMFAGYNVGGGKGLFNNPFAAPGGGHGAPFDDMTDYPAYTPGYTDSLGQKYGQGYDAFKTQALNKGPSNWLNMGATKNALDVSQGKQKALQENAGDTAGALGMLASTGGLTSGARERAIEQGGVNLSNQKQNIANTGNKNYMNMAMQDEENKLNMLSQLPGMEQGRLNNELRETAQKNDYLMRAYEAKMRSAAAERQAQATENAGGTGLFGGKGFLGLGF